MRVALLTIVLVFCYCCWLYFCFCGELLPTVQVLLLELLLIALPLQVRCLHTIAPTLTACSLGLLVHGEFFEYRCAGTGFPGSTSQQVIAEFGRRCGSDRVDVSFCRFKCAAEGGKWGYHGETHTETVEEFKARAHHLVEWLCTELWPLVSCEGLAIVVAHQTLLDLLVQLLVDNTAENWEYGGAKHKMRNADSIEVHAEAMEGDTVPKFKVVGHSKV